VGVCINPDVSGTTNVSDEACIHAGFVLLGVGDARCKMTGIISVTQAYNRRDLIARLNTVRLDLRPRPGASCERMVVTLYAVTQQY